MLNAKRIMVFIILFLVLIFNKNLVSSDKFIDSKKLEFIRSHNVLIAVYYTMGEEEFLKRITEKSKTLPSPGIKYLEVIMPVKIGREDTIAYIGSGTIIKRNHILTVKHLFDHGENTTGMTIWVVNESATEFMEATLVAKSEGAFFADDYAVIKTKKSFGPPGLPLEKSNLESGEKVIFIGSTGGLAFHTRMGFLSSAWEYFRKDAEGRGHLSRFDDFKLMMVWPGGPGDSGGSIISTGGRLAGIMYCGMEVHGTNFIFSNPISFAWKFLRKNKLEELAK